MRIKQSFLLNGPQISDNLAGELAGLDLAGTGIDGSSPGDTTYFSLYISIEASETEKAIYDYVKYLRLYIDSNSSYSGDYNLSQDLADILELGDLGYGLSLYNPNSGLYDLVFSSSNYNSESNALMIKKEMMRWYDLTDVSNPTIVNNYGITKATVSSSSTGYSLVSTTAVFNSNMVGNRVYNKTDGTSAIIESYVSSTNVILASPINDTWDGDEIYIKVLLEPQDGLIAINSQTAEILGDYAKLDFKFSLPSSYNRTGIKQYALKFITKI